MCNITKYDKLGHCIGFKNIDVNFTNLENFSHQDWKVIASIFASNKKITTADISSNDHTYNFMYIVRRKKDGKLYRQRVQNTVGKVDIKRNQTQEIMNIQLISEKKKPTPLFRNTKHAEWFGREATMSQIIDLKKRASEYEKFVNSVDVNSTNTELNLASICATNHEYIEIVMASSRYNFAKVS